MKKTFSMAVCLVCSATGFLALPSTCEAQILRRLFPGRYSAETGTYTNRSGLFNRGLVRGTRTNYVNSGSTNVVQPGAATVAPSAAPATQQPDSPQPETQQPDTQQPNTQQPNVTQSFYRAQGGNLTPSAAFPALTDGRGRIVLNVPANADVSWNGLRGSVKGSTRSYVTTRLTAEGVIQKFDARWTGPDGQPVSQTREIRAMPNTTVTLDFLQPAPAAEEKAPAAK